MKRSYTLFRWTGIALLSLLAACQNTPTQADPNAGEAAVSRALSGKALWEEKCRTVAGEKIYRKVENVEGLLLMKVRPERGDREWADRMWPGAAMAHEFPADSYIKSFLAYEYSGSPSGEPVGPQRRGYSNTDRRSGGLPGYRWVEVIDAKDGQRYRYTLVYKPRPTSKIGYIDAILDKTPSTHPTPRYGITYEDHVIAEDRYLGIASSTVKVLDLKADEVLGEMTRYAWSPGAPSRVNPSPWLTAYKCPPTSGELSALTRQFADQILIPAKEK